MTTVAGTGGARIAVHDLGPPGLAPAVLGHGVGSSSRFLREAFAAPLAALGHRLVGYDLRGHGASTPLPDPADHRLDAHAGDLDAVVREVGARVVGGVSLGAHAAAAWAAAGGGADALLLCLPAWTGREPSGSGPHGATAVEVREVGVAGVLERVAADARVPRWLRRLLERDWPQHDPDSLAAALVALDGGAGPEPAELGAIACPAGVVGWAGDPGHPIAVARAWATALPAAALAETTLEAVGAGTTALGAAAVRALLDAPPPRPADGSAVAGGPLGQDGLGGA